MALRIPSPKALTKPEAYLAYKAGIMSRDELKQSVYNPLNNYEGWLAKWCELLETYPTNKDGTPQCLTDEEGLLAYLCGVTDRYPTSNSRPDDARVSAYIRYLVSARYARPDHPLNREEFYLSLIKTQFIPSGDPSSDIVIDGTTKAPFLDVKVYGDTLQNSYSGKNLFDRANAYEDMALRWAYGDTYEEQNSIAMSNYAAVTAGDVISTNFRAQVMFYASDKRYLGALQADGETVATTGGNSFYGFTVPSGYGIAFFRLGYRTSNNNNANMNTQNIMVNFGNTVEPYEPYVGGTPAPNPDYPQLISVVTGEQTVKVVGKNLLAYPFATADGTYNGVTWVTEASGHIRGSGTTDSGTNFYLRGGTSKWIAPDSSTYTLSLNGTHTGMALIIRDDTTSTTVATMDSTDYATFTPTQGHEYRFYFNQSSSGRAVNINCYAMLEKGSTATSYQSYTEQDYAINLGELELAGVGETQPDGLPKYRDTIKQIDGKWYIEKQVGKVVLNGTETIESVGSNQCYRFVVPGAFVVSNVSVLSPVISDYYTSETPADVYYGFVDYGVSLDNNTSRIRIHNKDCANKTALATWLQSHNTTVYYALATPTTTEITNQSLIDQLNALKQGGAEEGTTYITVSATDPNLPAKLYVEAPKYD